MAPDPANGTDTAAGAMRWARVLLLLSVATPLVFYSETLWPFEVPRVVFFRAVVLVAVVVVGALLALGRVELSRRPDVVAWGLLAFLVASAVSALAGEAPLRSLHGSLLRSGGVVGTAHVVLFYGLLRTCFREEEWAWFLRAAAVVSFAVALVALAQEHGTAIGAWVSGGGRGRARGIIGNAGFMSIYLALGAMLALLLASRAGRAPGRIAWGVGAGLNAYALLLSGTRAVLVGVLVALLLAGPAWWWRHRGKRIGALVGIGFVLAAAVAAAGLSGLAGAGMDWAERLTSVSFLEGQNRLVAWDVALRGFLEHPLLGVGPENFADLYNRLADPARYNVTGAPSWDRAHNVYLGMLATRGAVGLVTYLSVWALLGWSLHRSWRSGRLPTADVAILSGGLIVYLVYLVFWFEDLSSLHLVVAVAAYVEYRRTGAAWGAAAERSAARDGRDRWPTSARLVGTALLALAVPGLWHDAMLLRTARQAHLGDTESDPWKGVAHFRSALDYGFVETRVITSRYLDLLEWLAPRTAAAPEGEVRDSVRRAFRLGHSALRREEERAPRSPDVYARWGRLHEARFRFEGSPAFVDSAALHLQRAVAMAPDHLAYYHQLASLLNEAGRREASLRVLNTALGRYDSYGGTYYYRARTLWAVGERTEAVEELRYSYDLGYNRQSRDFVFRVGRWLEEDGRHVEAARLYRGYVYALHPQLGKAPEHRGAARLWISRTALPVAAHLPIVHLRAGQPDSAVTAARELLRHLPARLQGTGLPGDVRRFIEDVESGRGDRWTSRWSVVREASFGDPGRAPEGR